MSKLLDIRPIMHQTRILIIEYAEQPLLENSNFFSYHHFLNVFDMYVLCMHIAR